MEVRWEEIYTVVAVAGAGVGLASQDVSGGGVSAGDLKACLV